MALTHTPKGELGSKAPDFRLKGVDGKQWGLGDFAQKKALLVAFICNHCPYVKAIETRLAQIANEYQAHGVGFVGINSNDSIKYPDDSFEAMKTRAREVGYPFPYLIDETQSVAHEYGAVCTPDFFLYQKDGPDFRLTYRGRLDDNWKDPAQVTQRDLARAIDAILTGQAPLQNQISSMGCSIKWK